MILPCQRLLLLLLACRLIWPGRADTPVADPLADLLIKQGYVRVELKRDRWTTRAHPGAGNNLYLDVRVEGRKQKWLLDTGCSITTLDRTVGKRFQTLATLGREADDPVLKNIDRTKLVLIHELDLGSIRLTNRPALVLDIGSRWNNTEMDALLGMDLLRRRHAFIDFLGRGLFLRPEAPDEKATQQLDASLRHSGWTVIPLTEAGTLCPYLEAQVYDRPLHFLVDSGAEFTGLDLGVARQLGLQPVRIRMTTRGVEDRAAQSYSTQVPLIRLPGLALIDEPFLVADLAAWQPKGGRHMDGILGADWLAVRSGLIDCQAGRLYVRASYQSKK